MSRKTLIMQNFGILDYHRHRIKIYRFMMISCRPQRSCYQVFSGYIPACLFNERIPRSLASEFPIVPSPLRGEG
jgi:hypothetical protein